MTTEEEKEEFARALQERIRVAREKQAAFEAENRGREELAELEKKAKFEENKARDLPEIKKAEDEHGTIRWFNTPDGAIVLKRPNHLAFNKFVRRQSDGKPVDNNDYWRLVKPCIVYPTVDIVEALTEKYAALTVKLAALVVELGGGEAEEVEGK